MSSVNLPHSPEKAGTPDEAGTWFQALLEQCHDGVFVLRNGVIVQASPGLAGMFGCRPEDLTGGQATKLVLPPDDIRLTEALRAASNTPGRVHEVDVRARMKHLPTHRDVTVRVRCFVGEQEIHLGTVHDTSDLRRTEKAMRDYARRLRHLSRQVLEVQEAERRHLARELHDEVGQQLTLIRFALERIPPRDRESATAIEHVRESVARLTQQVREMSLDLRPAMLDDLGLAATLRWYTHRIAALTGIEMVIDGTKRFPRLGASAETLFFRVAQEAVTNALRHSHAHTIRIRLELTETDVEMTVADDGCGFDVESVLRGEPERSSAGLLGMQERAALEGAVLTIRSAPEKGTRVSLQLSRQRAGIDGWFSPEISG